MTVRSHPATWFELLVPREELPHALALLASSHTVQLETQSRSIARETLPELRAGLEEYHELQRRYAAYWPTPRLESTDPPREPQRILDEALAQLRAWEAEAQPLVAALQAALTQRAELEAAAELLAAANGRLPALAQLASAGPQLRSSAFRLSPADWPHDLPTGLLVQRVNAAAHCYLVAVGLAEEIAALEEALLARKARRIPLPALPSGAAPEQGRLDELIQTTDRQTREQRVALERLTGKHGLERVLGDLAFIDWYTNQVPPLAATEHFAWVTGWTQDAQAHALDQRLDAAKVPHLLHLPPPPEGLEPPVTLRNPAWARAFELFPRLLGTPGLSEADPSLLVAIIAPLIFGFMFADVGQGVVLLAAGLVLRRRYPLLTLLVSGGAASIVFGLLFGSVFAREDLIHPLWVAPLEEPLLILGTTLGLGVVVVLLGLALDGLQHRWAGRGWRWCASRGGLVVFYGGLVLALADVAALWVAAAGALWMVAGSVACAPAGTRLVHIGPAIGEFLESALQIGVNTLSFLRVGAFSLAHSGLCVAIVGLASTVSSPVLAFALLLVGNVFVIMLEGLVAGIQTTRLVLFEFFVRFLRGSGREFRPLPEIDLARLSPKERST
jgi:V/A-type H+-transporting ATPase subunit I